MIPLEALSTRWPEISSLLDKALALPAAARTEWLETLTGRQAELTDILRELLAAHARAEAEEFLGTLPPLGRTDVGGGEPASGDTVGPYRLISELGRGGMGTVWLAERADGQPRREVALKLPRLAWGGALAERLARERDILATLAHPHIARLYDAGIDRHGRPYLAMEFVRGRPIDDYCRERRPQLRERLALLLQVCAAVAHAHARLVIHRDLKPSNILVTADGQVRLLDFGVAKLMEGDKTVQTSLTQMSGRALTLDYASPEQIRGEPLDTSSDVYSLAVVAYELLTDMRPYRLKRGSAAELEEAIASIDPPPASQAATEPSLKKKLRGDLDAILNKALKKKTTERYATVEALAQDLQRHLNQQPVLAQRDTFSYRAGKFIRRYRLQVGASGVVALTVLAGAGVALWQAREARAQALRAEAVKGFVLSIFENADTGAGGSRKTTAADLLKQARARLAKAPVTDSVIQVELLKSIGDSLIGLGEYQAAQEVLEEALQSAVAGLGAEHAGTIAVQLALGEALIENRQYRRAGPYLDGAERGMRRLGDDAGLVNTLRWKANLGVYESRFDEAISAASEAVRIAEQRLPSKRAVMLANHTLSNTLMAAARNGRLEPARRAYELALELSGGRTTVDTLNARSLFGYAHVLEGDASKGVTELQSLVAQQIDLLGPSHGDVLRTLFRIASASMALGDPRTAIDTYRRGLRIALEPGSGQARTTIGFWHMRLGLALANACSYEEADNELRRANEILSAELDANNYMVRMARSSHAFVLTRAGRLDEAHALFATLLAGPFSRPIEEALTKLGLGTLRSAQGQHEQALQLLRQSADHLANGSTRIDHARALAAIGAAQVEQGEAANAMATLNEARSLLEQLQPAPSPDRSDLMVNIARAHMMMGNPQAAAVSAEQAVIFWRSFGAPNRSSAAASLWHARALAALGRA